MGQGAPDWDPPEFVKEALVEVAHEKEDQYTRVGGHPDLVKIIAEEYSAKFNRNIDPLKEIVIANGAEGAINNFLFAFLDEGDEVIIFEPVFPAFLTMIEIYGGKLKFSTLEPPKENSHQWTINFESLEKLFSSKTKAIIINTPHNPTGKVFSKTEYDKLMSILNKWPQVIIFADEVYEHVIYDDNKHERIGSFPGMWERTVSVYSGGKIFSVTGWRIGWAVGPEYLISPMTVAQSWTAFSTNRPAQVAIAEAMRKASEEGSGQGHENFYDTVQKVFQEKKGTLTQALKKGPFDYKILNPEGGFFLVVDISKTVSKIPTKYFYEEGENKNDDPVKDISKLDDAKYTPDYAFVRWLLFEYRIACIPFFPFYGEERIKRSDMTFVRFTICKEDKTIQNFEDRLCQKKT